MAASGLSSLGFALILMAGLPLAGLPQEPAGDSCPKEIAAGTTDYSDITPEQIVDCGNMLLRGGKSHAHVSMTVERPEWKRTLDIESWNRGRDKALIVVHAPAKDKGTTTLRRGPEMWLWMPHVERVVKVPPTMMHSAWMGSNFTYEDIVKADSILKDYTHRILTRRTEGDHQVMSVEALPKPDAPVVWGRVLLTLTVYPNGYVIPMKEEDYSERGELIRSILLSEVGIFGGKTVPTRLECVPHRKPGERTVIKYHEIEFDSNIPETFFTLERLQKSK
jgi:hypothetical protein